MTDEQLERIVRDNNFEELLELLGLTNDEVFGILYREGYLDEDTLEDLCPL